MKVKIRGYIGTLMQLDTKDIACTVSGEITVVYGTVLILDHKRVGHSFYDVAAHEIEVLT